MIAFQHTAFIQQISGDPTTSNLLAQLLFQGSGTTAPNTLSNAPEGLYFVAPDGVRLIATNGIVSPAIGTQGDGVAMPFVNAQFPTRMAGAWFTDTDEQSPWSYMAQNVSPSLSVRHSRRTSSSDSPVMPQRGGAKRPYAS